MSSHLFSLLQIKSLILKNRIVVSPMCQYSGKDGFANDWHLVHLGARAIGGAALVIQEATSVSPEGRLSHEDLGIWDDAHIEKLKQITTFILSQNAFPGIQLAHAGRKASVTSPWQGNRKIMPEEDGWRTVAPSDIPYHDTEPILPIAMDTEAIQKVIADFRSAARRANEAGYKVLELHGAHGYLIHQFLSPLCNARTDEYGGSFENRVRFLMDVLDAVKEVWPSELPIFVRISGTDWADGGWNEDETVMLAELLKEKGVDVVDCSSGGAVSHQQIPTAPGYQVPISERIKKETDICTGAVGLITTAHQAEEILQKGQADLIFFGRESLRNPNLGLTFAHDLQDETIWPKQYERAKKTD